MDGNPQGNKREKSGPLHKVKSPDFLLLVAPKTDYGVSELSGDHFISKIPLNQAILHLFHVVIQRY